MSKDKMDLTKYGGYLVGEWRYDGDRVIANGCIVVKAGESPRWDNRIREATMNLIADAPEILAYARELEVEVD